MNDLQFQAGHAEPAEMSELIAKLSIGEGCEADAMRIERMVLSDDSSEAAYQYVERMHLLAGLRLLNASSAPCWWESPLAESDPLAALREQSELSEVNSASGHVAQPPTAVPASNHARAWWRLSWSRKLIAIEPRLLSVSVLVAAGVIFAGLVVLSILIVPHANPYSRSEVAEAKAASAVLATITASHQAKWLDSNGESTHVNRRLTSGHSLRLASGYAEVTFQTGAKVLLQGPCEFHVLEDNRATLQSGQLVARIPEQSKGFAVVTPQFTVVDLGTEFGVKVDIDGESFVQVFDGLVEVRPRGASSPTAPGNTPVAELKGGHRLEEGQSLRITPSGFEVVASDGSGQKFTRSLEKITATVAYWRFEAAEPGSSGPQDEKSHPLAAADDSGNGNHLYAASKSSAPRTSAAVAASIVNNTHQANRTCLDATELPEEPEQGRYLETNHRLARAPRPLEMLPLKSWTVEVSFLVKDTDRFHALVGKDGMPTGSLCAPVQLKVRQSNHMEPPVLHLELLDGSGIERHVRSGFAIQPNVWYHAAISCDGKRMRMYIKTARESAFRLVDESEVSGAMFHSHGAWSVGRGYWNGNKTDYSRALIDEVRISRMALEPDDFLFSEAPATEAK